MYIKINNNTRQNATMLRSFYEKKQRNQFCLFSVVKEPMSSEVHGRKKKKKKKKRKRRKPKQKRAPVYGLGKEKKKKKKVITTYPTCNLTKI